MLRCIIHRRIHIAIISVRVPQSKPVEIILCDAGHEDLNHIAAIRNPDLRLTVARCDDAGEGCWDERICRACVAENGLDKGGDAGRVAEIEICGNRKDFIGGGGGQRNVEICTSWVCRSERRGEEGGENEGARGKRLPDRRQEGKRRHSDSSRMISGWVELELFKVVMLVYGQEFGGKPCVLYSRQRDKTSQQKRPARTAKRQRRH